MESRKTDDVDTTFLCGDFNTGELDPIRKVLPKSVGSGIDFCLSTQSGDGGKKAGWPSDHSMVTGVFAI